MATEQKRTDAGSSRSDFGRTDADRDRAARNPDANPDPITGAPGSHPVGTGVGAAGGGVAGMAAGAAIGSVVPGVGTVAGGVIGAIVGGTGGGLAGKGIAESINPSAEDAYWRQNYKNRPYYSAGESYDEYAPAYRYGWEARSQHAGRRYQDIESDLGRSWDKVRANSRLGWDKARNATRDAWERIDEKLGADTSTTSNQDLRT